VKKATDHKGKEANVQMIDKTLERSSGFISTYTTLNAWPYQQQVLPA